jgi:hypothetical protein
VNVTARDVDIGNPCTSANYHRVLSRQTADGRRQPADGPPSLAGLNPQ